MRSLGLSLELGRWRRAGRVARLWWRDDDASQGSPELIRLLKLAEGRGVPITLAVVPAGDMDGLATALGPFPHAIPIQHGTDHVNRRNGDAAGEFPRDWTRHDVALTLLRGWRRVANLPRAELVFCPPWNDVHPELEAALLLLGYRACSGDGALLARSGALPRLDVHLDLLRWRRGARFRGRRRFLSALRHELRRRRLAETWDAPIGLLTHHQVHDEAAWTFLSAFLAWSSDHPTFSWVGLSELVPNHSTRAATAPLPKMLAMGASGAERSPYLEDYDRA